MSKRVVNKIVAFTLIIATVVFFQGTGNSYADIPKTTTPNPTISNAVVKTSKQTTNKTNVKVNVKKVSIDTVTRKSGTIFILWKKRHLPKLSILGICITAGTRDKQDHVPYKTIFFRYFEVSIF